MRLFVFEAVTGGAMVRAEPKPSLVHEADMMLRAVIADLRDIPDVQVSTTRDYRLPPLDDVELTVVDRQQDPLIVLDRAVAASDAVWLIAPETGGQLEQLARRVVGAGRTLLGCSPEAIALAAGKRATAEALATAGMNIVPTFSRASEIPPLAGPWVVKPDDGAGAEDTFRCRDADEAAARMGPGTVAQPWLEGDSLSLSLLCNHGTARLLSVNRQEIRIEDDRLSLIGIQVNAMPDSAGALAALGGQVAATIPGLFGWVGVDLIVHDGVTTVLEVNPRVTTSYCGLREALGVNPAAMIVGLARTGDLPSRDAIGAGSTVHLDLRLPDAG